MNALAPRLDRRRLLVGAGALVISVQATGLLPLTAQGAQAGTRPAFVPSELDSWIALAPDGAVTLFFGKVDMGQGVNVAIAQIVAEELDVDVARITVVMGDSALTLNQGGASGATGVQRGGAAFRIAAAEARRVLLERAAARLGVPVTALTVQHGQVSVRGEPERSLSYGALLSDGYFRETLGWNKQWGIFLTLQGKAVPKSPDQYTVVGSPVPRSDVPAKVFGSYRYVTDVRLEGMLHARMIRPPSAGAVPLGVDEQSIRPFAAQVVRKGDLIAVVAEREWQAVQAARALRVNWSVVPEAFPPQERLYEHLRAAPETFRHVATDHGDVDAGLAAAHRVIEADYEWPFQSHASLGGACAVADVRGDRATVWTGTQKPHFAAQGIAKITGLTPESVRVIWTEGPGSYGRNDAGDASHDAAVLSQILGKPVRVQYMRHEGTGWDPKAPPSVYRMRAGVNEQGELVAWDVSIKGLNKVDVSYSEAEPGDTLAGMLLGFPRKSPDALAFDAPDEAYQVTNKRIAWAVCAPLLARASPLRTAHMRDPVGPQNHFASESFFDEVAFAVKADPVQFRLRHLQDERDIAVVTAAAKRADWVSGPAGTRQVILGDWHRGRGFAYGRRDATWVAMVADVEVNVRTAELRVPRIVVAHDCGLIVNPRILNTVIEGCVLQGLSRTLHEEVRFTPRAVTSIDWSSYPILDIQEAPTAVDVVLIDRPHIAPSGAGEPATRLVAAAVNNAVFEAIGRRLRRAPLNRDRLRQALA